MALTHSNLLSEPRIDLLEIEGSVYKAARTTGTTRGTFSKLVQCNVLVKDKHADSGYKILLTFEDTLTSKHANAFVNQAIRDR